AAEPHKGRPGGRIAGGFRTRARRWLAQACLARTAATFVAHCRRPEAAQWRGLLEDASQSSARRRLARPHGRIASLARPGIQARGTRPEWREKSEAFACSVTDQISRIKNRCA